ncbi:hypothetical protein AGMMS4952_14170 [Spirochaetia bacterium]|nr:hypothetical protein AGMMS4952_14170 [Spirochaetia bacterium]
MKIVLIDRIHNRPIKIVIGFLMALAAAASLNAQETIDGIKYSNVGVWIAPTIGGTAADREYFDFNLAEEIKGGGYDLTNEMYPTPEEARQNSDFYITTSLEYDEEYQDNVINAELYNTRTGALIITTSMGYQTTEEMNDWNLTMIYRLMANAPISKSTNMELSELYPGQDRGPKKDYPEYRLFLGLRGGYSSRFYTAEGYLQSNSVQGNTFETAFHVSYLPWRYLGFQAEVLFTMDFATFSKFHITGGNNAVELEKTSFQSMSLMVPLIVKGNIPLSRFIISPLVGLYFTFPLGVITATDKDSAYESVFSYSPPLGFLAGAELGMHLGPGILFLDVRYAGDFGNTLWENGDPIYGRSMITVSLGYKFGLLKKKKPEPNE